MLKFVKLYIKNVNNFGSSKIFVYVKNYTYLCIKKLIMTDFKIKVNPWESEMIQKLLFLAGYTWRGGSTDIINTEYPHLYLNSGTLSCSLSEVTFNIMDNPEITFEQFLNEIEFELIQKSI